MSDHVVDLVALDRALGFWEKFNRDLAEKRKAAGDHHLHLLAKADVYRSVQKALRGDSQIIDAAARYGAGQQ